MKTRAASATLAAIGIACWSCATLFQGTSEEIMVASDPSGAQVSISEGRSGVTPFSLYVPRSEYLNIHLTKAGYFSESGPTESPGIAPVTDVAMGSVAYLDARNGFRDMKFGEPPKSGMVLTEKQGDLKFYRRASDDLTVGSGRVAAITYIFYKNRLFTVMLQTKGIMNSQALLATFRAAYGPGDKPNEFLDAYLWSGKIVSVSYNENLVTKNATALIKNRAIARQKHSDEKAAAERSGGNL